MAAPEYETMWVCGVCVRNNVAASVGSTDATRDHTWTAGSDWNTFVASSIRYASQPPAESKTPNTNRFLDRKLIPSCPVFRNAGLVYHISRPPPLPPIPPRRPKSLNCPKSSQSLKLTTTGSTRLQSSPNKIN
uniref:(northern house mosquito) hypothetical protein n=2 Tax=Culex pipiens TaxID=7175 RepID=A0A8D8NIE0_CULPI